MSDTSNLSRKSYEKKDDVVINSIYLYTPDTLVELDGGDFVKELIIYENMIDCFQTGLLVLTDNNRLSEIIDFTEACYVVVSYRTPLPKRMQDGMGGFVDEKLIETPATVVFKVYETVSKTRGTKQTAQFEALHLVSPSLFLNDISVKSQSVRGNAIDIIRDLTSNYFYDRSGGDSTSGKAMVTTSLPNFKQISLERLPSDKALAMIDDNYEFLKVTGKTTEELKIAFPFSRALYKIKEIAYDLETNNGQQGYMFWETHTGFKLAPRQYLYEQKPLILLTKSQVDAQYNSQYNPGPIMNIYDMDDFEIGGSHKRSMQIREGAFQSTMYVYDITNKTYYKSNFSYNRGYVGKVSGRYPVINPNKITPRFTEVSDGVHKVFTKDIASGRFNTSRFSREVDERDFGHADVQQLVLSEEMLSMDTYMEVNTSGMHFIEAGNTVQILIPPATASQDNSSDKQLSTTYLVDSVTHVIDFITKSHRMKLGLSKNFKTTESSTVQLQPSEGVGA